MFKKLLSSLNFINDSYEVLKKASMLDISLSNLDTSINILTDKTDPNSISIHYWKDPIKLHCDSEVDQSSLKEFLSKYFKYYPCPISIDHERIFQTPLLDFNPETTVAFADQCSRDLFTSEFNTSYSKDDPILRFHMGYPYKIDAWFYFSSKLKSGSDSIRVYNSGIYQDSLDIVPDFLYKINKSDSYIQGIISTYSLRSNPFINSSIKNFITKKIADSLVSAFNRQTKKSDYINLWYKTSSFIKQACVYDIDFFSKIKEVLFIEFQKQSVTDSKLLVSVDNFLQNIYNDSSCYSSYSLCNNSPIDHSYYSFLVDVTGSKELKDFSAIK